MEMLHRGHACDIAPNRKALLATVLEDGRIAVVIVVRREDAQGPEYVPGEPAGIAEYITIDPAAFETWLSSLRRWWAVERKQALQIRAETIDDTAS